MRGNQPPDPLLPRLPLAYGAAFAALVGAAMRVIVVPVLVGSLFDQVLVAGDFSRMGPVLLTGGLITLVGAFALWLQDSLFGRLAGTVAAQWRDATYAALLDRNALAREQSSGGLASRIIADLKECEIHLQYGLSSLVAESVTILGILAFLFAMNAQATLILLLLALPLVLVLNWLGKRVERVSGRVLQKTEDVGAHLQEGLGQLEVSRAFGLGRYLRGRLAQDNRQLLHATARRAAWAGTQTPAAQVLGFLALAVLIWLLVGSVQDGSMTLGQLTSYVTLLALLGTPMTLLPRAWAMLKQAQAAASRLKNLLGEPLPPKADATSAQTAAGTTLELAGLGFNFDDGDGPLFSDLNLRLQGPALVALLGHSGSGKSTLLRLLLGLLAPTEGSIRLNGAELDTMSDRDLRELLAYVPQNAALFRASLQENLDLGRGFPEGRIRETLAEVGLSGLPESLPGGLAYSLAERGSGLSGGQLQRLAIARALLADPGLLLLDEPTASLDEASEQEIIAMLRQQASQRLVLVTTHRPALLEHADVIIELAAGGTLRQHELTGDAHA